MLDSKKYSKNIISKLYKERWTAETDLGAIKTTMKMDVLNSKSPKMVDIEIGAHILAYNLIRALIVKASKMKKIHWSKSISHKAALQLIGSFRHSLIRCYDAESLELFVENIITLLTLEKVKNRPGRSEIRAVKRRPKAFPRLTRPRAKAA